MNTFSIRVSRTSFGLSQVKIGSVSTMMANIQKVIWDSMMVLFFMLLFKAIRNNHFFTFCTTNFYKYPYSINQSGGSLNLIMIKALSASGRCIWQYGRIYFFRAVRENNFETEEKEKCTLYITTNNKQWTTNKKRNICNISFLWVVLWMKSKQIKKLKPWKQ